MNGVDEKIRGLLHIMYSYLKRVGSYIFNRAPGGGASPLHEGDEIDTYEIEINVSFESALSVLPVVASVFPIDGGGSTCDDRVRPPG
jgi:hypothetical protein